MMAGLVRLTAVAMACAVTAMAVGAQPRRASSTAPPPRWEATREQLRALVLDGKHQEMLALIEPIATKNPEFADGQFWLGAAHENLGRDVMRTDPAAARRHFEPAAAHLRRAYELGGADVPEATIRGLIDLYDYALPDPAARRALILDAHTRYAAEPVAHWYYVTLLIEEQRAGELPAAFGAARKALPATPPDARLAFASLLVGLAERSPGPVRTALAAEAESHAREVAKAYPTGAYSRQAQRVRDALAKLPRPGGA